MDCPVVSALPLWPLLIHQLRRLESPHLGGVSMQPFCICIHLKGHMKIYTDYTVTASFGRLLIHSYTILITLYYTIRTISILSCQGKLHWSANPTHTTTSVPLSHWKFSSTERRSGLDLWRNCYRSVFHEWSKSQITPFWSVTITSATWWVWGESCREKTAKSRCNP